MENKKIKDWKTKSGLRAVIQLVAPSYPHYCGYVLVPKNHPAYKKPCYKSIEDMENYKENYKHIMEQMNTISVHGGLTYSETVDITKNYPAAAKEGQWFGFDAAHAGDAVDWEAGKVLINKKNQNAIEESKKIFDKFPIDTDTIKTKQYIIDECEKLAEQLKNIKEK